jgi:membrane protease subunit (stomatin/prohibitin family)
MSDEKTLDDHIEDVRDENSKENESGSADNLEVNEGSEDVPNNNVSVGVILIFGVIGVATGGLAAGPSSAVIFGIIASVVGLFISLFMSEEFREEVEEIRKEKEQQRQQQQQQQQAKASEAHKTKVVCQHCGWQNNNNNNYCNDCGEPINESS